MYDVHFEWNDGKTNTESFTNVRDMWQYVNVIEEEQGLELIDHYSDDPTFL